MAGEDSVEGTIAASRDYFAEMYVAGVLADGGWNLYFPHRDIGFDMIATKRVGDTTLVRPVQVKGKYASDGKTAKARYGYVGKLTALHPDMVLAIPFFTSDSAAAPLLIAWMPYETIKPSSRGHACEPARFDTSGPEARRDFAGYFGPVGLAALEATVPT